jgi:hypothetical protein
LQATPRTFPAVVSTTAAIDADAPAASAAGVVNPGSAASAVPHNEDLRIARRLASKGLSAIMSLSSSYRYLPGKHGIRHIFERHELSRQRRPDEGDERHGRARFGEIGHGPVTTTGRMRPAGAVVEGPV